MDGRRRIDSAGGLPERQETAPFDGPEFEFANPARPARLSFFVRLDPHADTDPALTAGTWGGMVALYDAQPLNSTARGPYAAPDEFRDVGYPAVSTPLPHRTTPQAKNATVIVGISLSDRLTHGSGFRVAPGEDEYAGPAGVLGGAGRGAPRSTLLHKARLRRWYKVDVSMDWASKTYDVWVDDVLRASAAPLKGTQATRVGVYAMSDQGSVRVDEIYVGPDYSMGFRCPETTRSGLEFATPRPDAPSWGLKDLGGRTSRGEMKRHDNHVSRREVYQHGNGGLVEYDGAAAVEFRSDVQQRFEAGDLRNGPNGVHAGALLTVPGGVAGGGGASRAVTEEASRRTDPSDKWTGPDHADAEFDDGHPGNYGAYSKTHVDADAPQRLRRFYESKYYAEWYDREDGRPTPTHYWYGEHDAPHGPLQDGSAPPAWLEGGIGACSTDDLISWKREGVALHFANLSDMVRSRDAWLPGCDGYATAHGTAAGYGCVGSAGLRATRPRTLVADLDARPDAADPYAAARPDAPGHVEGHGFVMRESRAVNRPRLRPGALGTTRPAPRMHRDDAGPRPLHECVIEVWVPRRWMGVDDANRTGTAPRLLALAGVASAAHAGGPFSFRRSLYPDGNETRDMAARPAASCSFGGLRR